MGVGNLERGQISEAEKFYEDMGSYAKNAGITVNVISMKGTDCKLSMLGKLSDLTNGSLTIVNPLNLSKEFQGILDNRIVATNVRAKLIINHKYLYIRDEELLQIETSMKEEVIIEKIISKSS